MHPIKNRKIASIYKSYRITLNHCNDVFSYYVSDDVWAQVIASVLFLVILLPAVIQVADDLY